MRDRCASQVLLISNRTILLTTVMLCVMSVLCTPLQVKCYQRFYIDAIFVLLNVCFKDVLHVLCDACETNEKRHCKKKVLLVNVVRTSLDLSDTETTELRVC